MNLAPSSLIARWQRHTQRKMQRQMQRQRQEKARAVAYELDSLQFHCAISGGAGAGVHSAQGKIASDL